MTNHVAASDYEYLVTGPEIDAGAGGTLPMRVPSGTLHVVVDDSPRTACGVLVRRLHDFPQDSWSGMWPEGTCERCTSVIPWGS